MRLAELRKSAGIKQATIAQSLGIAQSTYSQYEIGIRQPDPDMLILIADYFEVSVDYLLGRTDENIRKSPPSEDDEPDTDAEEMAALINQLSDDALRSLLDYARFLAQQAAAQTPASAPAASDPDSDKLP